MVDQLVKRSEPTRLGRIFLVFAGMALGFSLGVQVGEQLGSGARLGGVLVYQIAMGVALVLLWCSIWTRLRAA
jgi:hypothetical protein